MSDDAKYGYIPPTGERTVSINHRPVSKPTPPGYRGEIAADLQGVSIRPTGCKVLIELDEASAFYEGTNILMPQEYRDVAETGTVRAVGEGYYVGGNDQGVGCRHYPLSLKPGDRVRLHRWNMTEVLLDGKLFVIMPEADVHYVEDDMKDSERRYSEDCLPEVGDIVRESGAGTEMPVTGVNKRSVVCRFVDPDHKLAIEGIVHEEFPLEGLILVRRAES